MLPWHPACLSGTSSSQTFLVLIGSLPGWWCGPLSEGPTSVLVVSFYGYPGDAPRTSLAFESLMSAVATFGGPYVILGNFNLTQTEGSLAALLATGAIRAADDTGGSLHPNTNPTDTRRIDFAVAHPNLVASQVNTFRMPAISDHGIVRVDFPTTCFPRSWKRPAFSPAPAPADVPDTTPADPGPEFPALLNAGHLDKAWTYLSDWAERALGISCPPCPRSAAWLPAPRPTPCGTPGAFGHEPAPLSALRRLSRRLCQLEQQPWDVQLQSSIARSLRRARALAPELPHLDLDAPSEARACVEDLVDTRQQQHRFLCLQRWKEKTALSSLMQLLPGSKIVLTSSFACSPPRLSRKCPLPRSTRQTVYDFRARSGPASGKHPRPPRLCSFCTTSPGPSRSPDLPPRP